MAVVELLVIVIWLLHFADEASSVLEFGNSLDSLFRFAGLVNMTFALIVIPARHLIMSSIMLALVVDRWIVAL